MAAERDWQSAAEWTLEDFAAIPLDDVGWTVVALKCELALRGCDFKPHDHKRCAKKVLRLREAAEKKRAAQAA